MELIDGELLLFHPTETKVLYCNQTASLIWQLCDGTRTIEEITGLLVSAFPEATDSVAKDIKSTLEKFHQRGVIEFI